jgi:lipopolysaccharide export system protein LptA
MNPSPHRRARRGGIRSAALLGAVVATSLLLAGVVWLAMSQTPAVESSQAPTPPDITQIAPNQRTRQLAGSVRMQVRVVDKDDPTRAVGELIAARSTPLEGKRYSLEQPQVWIYLNGGRRLWLSAARGQALIPDFTGSRPEDGTIQGDVVGRLFEARPDGSEPDPHGDEPLLTLRTDLVRFDLRLGEVRIPGELTLEGPAVSFEGAEVLAVLNEADERIELLRIEQTHRLTIRPDARASRSAPAATTDTTPFADETTPSPQAPQPPRETLYTVTSLGDVRIAQGERSIRSEELTAWVRLIDQALPEGALAPLAEPRSAPSTEAPPGTNLASQPASPTTTGTEPVAADPEPAKNTTLELAWTGAMELRPLDATPAQLQRNHVYLHATSPEGALVRLHDGEQNITALGQSAQYGATRREGTLAGLPARVERTGTGFASADTLTFDLTEGVITSTGRGTLAAEDSDESQRRVVWTNDARFTLLNDESGSPRSISAASLFGDVHASDGTGFVRGKEMHARFEPADPRDLSSPAYLHTLRVVNSARASDGKEGVLESDSLVVLFSPRTGEDAGQSDPTHIDARGSVSAASGTDRLNSDSLVAELSLPTDTEPSQVQQAVAQGSVRFDRADGVFATGESLVAHPGPQTVRITGADASIGQGLSTAFGTKIDLDGLASTLTIPTPGRIEHTQPGTDGQPPLRLTVAWTDSLTYDDAQGMGECRGDVTAQATQGDLARDTLTGALVQLALERTAPTATDSPHDVDQKHKPEVDEPALFGGNRRLLWSRAQGSAESGPAKIEVRRYATAPEPAEEGATIPESSLERLLYLEGAEIRVDHAAAIVDVPSAGKLLVLDRRASAEPTRAPLDPLQSTQTPRGTALFTWAQSARFDQGRGVAVLNKNATMTHAPQDGGERVDLQCETLTAYVDQPEGDAPGQSGTQAGGLRSAVAQGDVWLRMAQKELTSDMMTYDAARRRAEATGTAPGRVTAFDPANGAPVSATRVIWDMAADRFQLIGIDQPIVSPR